MRSAQAFSTGQTNVSPFFEGLPVDGSYILRNVRSGQFIDADGDGSVNISNVANADDMWELINIGGDMFNLRNEVFGGFLDGDGNGRVDQSEAPFNDDRWQLIPTNAGSFFLYSPVYDRFVGQIGRELRLTPDETAAERWFIETPDLTNPLVGQSIALQNELTSRFVDADPDGQVDQSLTILRDDIWNVLDAGDGYVFFESEAFGRFLDGDGANANVDTSRFARSDDRWIIMDDEATGCDPAEAIATGCSPHVLIMNVDSGGYLAATGFAQGFNVVTEAPRTDAATWSIVDPS